MTDRQELMKRASQLIRDRQYDRARAVLRQLPNDPEARVWLAKLDQLDPTPATLEEAQEELVEAQAEIEQAEHDLEQAEHDLVLTEKTVRRSVNISVALLVFFGSLMGSLLGAAADFNDAQETFHSFKAQFYPELCIAGSDTILGPELGMAAAWGEAFEERHNVRVTIDAVGSGRGVDRATGNKCIHVLAMSEPLEDAPDNVHYHELVDAGVEIVCAAEIGYDIIAFITDKNNPIEQVVRHSLQLILKGRILNWSEVDTRFDYPITVLARRGSGTTDLVLDKIAYYNSNGGRVFPADANYEECFGNDDCLDRTLSTIGSLYWGSVAWIKIQPAEYLRVLPIASEDGIANPPMGENEKADIRTYPRALIRPLYLYVVDNGAASDEQLELAREFLFFVRGLEGQKILDQHFYTYFNQPQQLEVPLLPGFDAVDAPNRQICHID